MLKIILISFLICNTALASCPSNVQKLKEGSTTNCDGWLVSEPQMQTFTRQDDELELQRKFNKVTEHLRTLDQAEIEYYKTRTHNAEKQVDKLESNRFWSNLGHFALGVVITGLAAKTAIEATK